MQQISLATQLERYIHENYNHNVTVNTTEILCNDDKSVAICDLQFVGPSATNALEAFVNDLSNSSNSIDFVIFRLRLCHQNCQESNVTSGEEPTDENQNKENILGKNVATVILILIIIFASVLIVFSLMACYLRFVCNILKFYVRMWACITTLCSVNLVADLKVTKS